MFIQYRLAYTKLGTLNCVTLKPALSNSSTLMAISEDIELELECVGASQWTGATPFASCAGALFPGLIARKILTQCHRYRLRSELPNFGGGPFLELLLHGGDASYPRVCATQ